MPTINFPSGPSLNDTYNLGLRTWKWNGDAWALEPLTGGFTGSQGYTGSVGIGYTGSVGIGYTGSSGYTGSNIVLLDETQTLTNKTLTTPDVNTSLKMVSSGQLQFRDNQSYISENGGILLFNGAAGRGVRMYSAGAERVAVTYAGDLELKAGTDIIFEGSTANDFETTLTVTDPTADRNITLPDSSGTVVLADTTDTLTNKTLTSPNINEAVALTATATELNYLDGVTGITLGTANELLVVGSDGSSIASDSTLAVDTSNNRLGINQSSPEVTLHMTGEDAQTAQIRMEQYNDSADAPDVRTRRYRGTIASPSAVSSGDYLFRSNHEYYNGSSLIVGGSFAFDNTNNANRTQFAVSVNTDGTSADPNIASKTQFKIDGNDSGAITFNNAYKFPTIDGNANQVLKTDGSGNLSFTDVSGGSGGTSWQSTIVTGTTLTAVAGNGYWINTTSNACTVTLPASASVGDSIQIVDYAGTFATNNITLTSSLNIEGGTSDKFLTTNREGVTITYADATQGWVATSGVNSGDQGIDPTNSAIIADFLVIAGGGGGGSSGQVDTAGGGGGAGGYRNSYSTESSGGGGSSETSLNLTTGTTYTITVGAGGGGGAGGAAGSVWNQGATGSNSIISGSDITTITSSGGGGGGTYYDGGIAGGSGGGGGAFTAQTGGSGTSNQGFSGQTTSSQGQNSGQIAGGGGGASEAGGTDGAGHGGDGLSSSITGSSVSRGAGGGGAGNVSSSGGTGGGGDGKNSSGAGNGTAGTTNTGSGGGGAYTGNSGSHSGGAGGSGVVILRLPTSQYSGTTTGSPTVTTDGTDTILIYNASGSYTA
jgi:hypothetical protein